MSGSAIDAGCRGTAGKASVKGAVLRVQVSVARVNHGLCSFMALSGRLQRPARSCATTYAVLAKGTSRFHLDALAHLPAGTYRIDLQGIDHAGNLERAHGVTVTVAAGSITKVVG